ncbi:hypothetical protein SB861_43475 [Paraburkholderia sp. SIMBA_049]
MILLSPVIKRSLQAYVRGLHQETFSSASILEAQVSLPARDKAACDFILLCANVCAITYQRLIDLIAPENIVHNIFLSRRA